MSEKEPRASNRFRPKELTPMELANRAWEILDEEKGPRALIIKREGRKAKPYGSDELRDLREEYKLRPDSTFNQVVRGLQGIREVILIDRPTS